MSEVARQAEKFRENESDEPLHRASRLERVSVAPTNQSCRRAATRNVVAADCFLRNVIEGTRTRTHLRTPAQI